MDVVKAVEKDAKINQILISAYNISCSEKVEYFNEYDKPYVIDNVKRHVKYKLLERLSDFIDLRVTDEWPYVVHGRFYLPYINDFVSKQKSCEIKALRDKLWSLERKIELYNKLPWYKRIWSKA